MLLGRSRACRRRRRMGILFGNQIQEFSEAFARLVEDYRRRRVVFGMMYTDAPKRLKAQRGVHCAPKANEFSEVLFVEQRRSLKWSCQARQEAAEAMPNVRGLRPLFIGKHLPTPFETNVHTGYVVCDNVAPHLL